MALTNLAINALKPRERSYKVADGRGLYIEVTPGGSKLWRYKYRLHGKEKRLAMGRFPETSIVEARRRRDQARLDLDAGRDPSLERRRQKLVAALSASTTFDSIAREYIDKMKAEGRAGATVDKALWLLAQLQPLHAMPIADIRPIDMLGALERIKATGRHETAKRCRSLASRIFRYAVATQRAEGDPAAALRGALITPRPKHHAALLDPAEVGALLRAIEAYDGHAITRYAMMIAPHVMARPGELRQARWCEFNLARAVWNIPAERMKMRRPHSVPLSKQVVRYLGELHDLTGPDGFVFPAFHTNRRPMSENTMNQVLRRLAYSKDQMTSHGWRTTAATLLNESGKWSEDAIERSLAHRDRDAVRGTYNRGNYWDERLRMHQWWSDHLDVLREGGEVVQFEQERASADNGGAQVIDLWSRR